MLISVSFRTSVFIISLMYLFSFRLFALPAPVTLAKTYSQQKPLTDYLVSEKYDGVRAFWNGQFFTTRNGHKINVPNEWILIMPSLVLDGELRMGYNTFDQVSGLVRRQQSSILDWQEVQYRVFDAPEVPGTFYQRYLHYKKVVETINAPFLQVVEQKALTTETMLYQWLDQIITRGGEGLMLRDINADYHVGRHASLLKLKRHQDAEAIVIGYLPGKGKYKGQVGALLVKNEKGVIFKVGSGLSDENRRNPPKIGAFITYRYTGITSNGLPRFPRFWRVRPATTCFSGQDECD